MVRVQGNQRRPHAQPVMLAALQRHDAFERRHQRIIVQQGYQLNDAIALKGRGGRIGLRHQAIDHARHEVGQAADGARAAAPAHFRQIGLVADIHRQVFHEGFGQAYGMRGVAGAVLDAQNRIRVHLLERANHMVRQAHAADLGDVIQVELECFDRSS